MIDVSAARPSRALGRTAAVLAAIAMVTDPGHAQRRACVTNVEAEALTLVAMPQIIRETGRVCAGRLPPTSIVRRPSGPFIDKYDAAADAAWPQARATIGKLSLGLADGLLTSDFARPLLVSLIVPQIVARISTADCATIDRLVSQLEPLPPRNTAGVIVTSMSYLKAQRAKGQRIDVPDLPLCSAEVQ